MVRRVLEPQLVGKRICGVRFLNPGVVAWPQAEKFAEGVRGRRIAGMARRGKFLQILLDDGACIVVHFRMTGCLLLMDADSMPEKHTHVIVTLDDGRELRYSDQRRFGRLWLIPIGADGGADAKSETPRGVDGTFRMDAARGISALGLSVTGMDKLGPEPFDESVTWKYLREKLGSRRTSIKEGLLDQGVIAGIGNIYSDEILFAGNIYPGRAARSLTTAQWKRLAAQIPATMKYYVEKNEISFEDYVKGRGKDYRNTPYLKVYGHKGEPCPRCGTPLESARIGGRSSVYCVKCQK